MQKIFTTDRVSRLFHEVWRKVPATYRSKIEERLAYITDDPSHMPWRLKESDDNDGRANLGVTYADCSLNAVVLFPDRLAGKSDRRVRYIIAHELGHVCMGHVPTFGERMDGKVITDEPEEIRRHEMEANLCVVLWGIPTGERDKATGVTDE